ncbi:origin recognition complex subunit 4 [Actinidia rufa]|uniref:Origin recognition complex subunit 4 n=1 Tax=Actinidia rufa TaxID=165716 RepID=A0A7J0GYN3_9ERIC|nr:origin recognition complex subunit 4 [Actinidia rufa]
MGRENLAGEALILLRSRLCNPKFIFSPFSDSPDSNYSKLKFILSSSVTEACNNSVLLLGPRGCGKNAVLELVIEDLLKEYPDMISVIKLNGLLHSDDNCAVKVQLDTLLYLLVVAIVLTYLNIFVTRECGLAHKTVMFVLDEFDLFAQGKQRLLYCLLDAMQSVTSQAVVIGVSCRLLERDFERELAVAQRRMTASRASSVQREPHPHRRVKSRQIEPHRCQTGAQSEPIGALEGQSKSGEADPVLSEPLQSPGLGAKQDRTLQTYRTLQTLCPEHRPKPRKLGTQKDADQLLEKRVRSRFSHRKLLFLPPSKEDLQRLIKHILVLPTDSSLPHDYVVEFNAKLLNILAKERFKQIIDTLSNSDSTCSNLLRFLFSAVCHMDLKTGFLLIENFKAALSSIQRQPKLEGLKDCSILELYMLVCMWRLEVREQDSYNFNSVMKEYRSIHDSFQTSDYYARNVCLRAFEHLLERELISFMDHRGHNQSTEFRPAKLLISYHELYQGLKSYRSCPIQISCTNETRTKGSNAAVSSRRKKGRQQKPNRFNVNHLKFAAWFAAVWIEEENLVPSVLGKGILNLFPFHP